MVKSSPMISEYNTNHLDQYKFNRFEKVILLYSDHAMDELEDNMNL